MLTSDRTFSSKVTSQDALTCFCISALLAKPSEGSALCKTGGKEEKKGLNRGRERGVRKKKESEGDKKNKT